MLKAVTVLLPLCTVVSVGVKDSEIIEVPEAEGVKLTLQLAPVIPGTRMQLVWSKAPVAPVKEKLTEPTGVIAALPVEVSSTVAVQDEGVLTITGVAQVTVVDVVRRSIVILAEVVVLLLLWAVSVAATA